MGILANPQGHEGKTYTLHGPVEMNHTEIAAVMTDVLGARIEYARGELLSVPKRQQMALD